MAILMKDVIESEFAGYFKVIVFAIVEDTNSMQHYQGNLRPFQQVMRPPAEKGKQ